MSHLQQVSKQLRIKLYICGIFTTFFVFTFLWHSEAILFQLNISETSFQYKDEPTTYQSPSSSTAQPAVISNQRPHHASPDIHGFLPLEEAKVFCQHRRFAPYKHRNQRRKIYDLILINTELDWLEIRLGQMYAQVDYFVILESTRTFTNTAKPLSIAQNWDRFARYHDKMIRHTLNESGFAFTTPWKRERFSRNAVYEQVIPYLTGPQSAHPGDVLLVADVDELPRPDALTALRNCEIPDNLTLGSRMYYYSFQWLNRVQREWPHPQATLFKGLHGNTTTILPDTLRKGPHPHTLRNAGWHCSYCFATLEEMVNKVTSFSHAEYNKPRFRDPRGILRRVREGLDIFDRADSLFDRVEGNADVPWFVKENEERFDFVLDRDGESASFRDYYESVGKP